MILRSLLKLFIAESCLSALFEGILVQFTPETEWAYLTQCHRELIRIYGIDNVGGFQEFQEYFRETVARVGKEKVWLYEDFDLKSLRECQTII